MRISDWSSDVCSSDLGGAAGFAKGGARVRLADEGAATLLSYDVDAQVGGKLAQIGSRLIDGTAKKMADDFFSRFTQTVERGEAPAPGEAAPPPPVTVPDSSPPADRTSTRLNSRHSFASRMPSSA